MATKKISNEFMEKVLTDSAWKILSRDFQWTEQMLEKWKDKVDWKEVSNNREILWTPSMLEKFKKLLDWHDFSSTDSTLVLTEACLEQYKNYWDWSVLSENTDLVLTYDLIDKFIDNWDWDEIIDRWQRDNDKIYSVDFLERYHDKIPSSKLQSSHLWSAILDEKVDALKIEIVS